MTWTLDSSGTHAIWRCSSYSDLNYAEINNFAHYGQPFSPYESGFKQNHVPDFANIIIEMPQSEVMINGYGRNIQGRSFPIVQKFLRLGHKLPLKTFTLKDLVTHQFARLSQRWIKSNLYGYGAHNIDAGTINSGDAAYIHGTVSFALMRSTRFHHNAKGRLVEAEIGAGNDNWDFNSSNVPVIVNALVKTLFGPDHYNLTAPIQLRYTGSGKRVRVRLRTS